MGMMKRVSGAKTPVSKRQKVKRQRAVVQGAMPLRRHTEEKKNFDLSSGQSDVVFNSTVAVVFSIFTPINGTSPVQHQGREVTLKSL